MSALSYFGPPLVTLLVTLLLAWRIGAWSIARIRCLSSAERAILSLCVGFAEIGFGTFALGLCHLLMAKVLLFIAGALLVVAALGALRFFRDPVSRLKLTVNRLVVTAAATLFAGALMVYLGRLALYPATAFDATMYHLALAKSYVAGHSIAPALSLRYPVMPQLNECIFAAVFGFGGELAAHAIEFVLLLLTAGTLMVWASRWFSARAGLVAVAALFGSPLVVFLGTTGYIDASVALFTTAGCFVLSRWTDERERGCLWLGGALLGVAADCKYLGLVSLAISGVWIAVAAFRRKQWAAPFETGLAALVVILPFYGYVFYFTHNPFFPFYGQWFGYSYWTAEESRTQFSDITAWGGERSLTGFLCVLRNVAEMPIRFHSEAPISTAYFFGWPFACLAALFNSRLRTLFVLSLAYLTFWFFQTQIARYLTPFLPILCLACSGSVLWLLEQLPRTGRRLASWPVAIGLALLVLWPSLDWAARERRYRGPIPVGAAQRDTYLRAFVPAYQLVELLNRTGAHYRVHGIFTESLAYYFDGQYFGDHFGPYSYERIYECRDGECIASYLSALNIEYLLVLDKRVRHGVAFRSPSFPLRFSVLGKDPSYTLYRVNAPARAAATPAP